MNEAPGQLFRCLDHPPLIYGGGLGLRSDSREDGTWCRVISWDASNCSDRLASTNRSTNPSLLCCERSAERCDETSADAFISYRATCPTLSSKADCLGTTESQLILSSHYRGAFAISAQFAAY